MVQTGGFPFRDVNHLPLPGGNGSSNDYFQGAAQWSDLTCWLWSRTTCAQTLTITYQLCDLVQLLHFSEPQ